MDQENTKGKHPKVCQWCNSQIKQIKDAGTKSTETTYKCGVLHHSYGGWWSHTRTSNCYESEIAQLRADLRDAIALLKSLLSQPFYAPGWVERDIQLYLNRPSVKGNLNQYQGGTP